MSVIILLFAMLFCHIIDDYYLQGWLASAKQKTWWEQNAPDPLYEKDYRMALVEHAFSWACSIHFPVLVFFWYYSLSLNLFVFLFIFFGDWVLHAVVDNMKANKKSINLITDQYAHFTQIVVTWLVYIVSAG